MRRRIGSENWHIDRATAIMSPAVLNVTVHVQILLYYWTYEHPSLHLDAAVYVWPFYPLCAATNQSPGVHILCPKQFIPRLMGWTRRIDLIDLFMVWHVF